MRVFISWSGDQSKALAEALHEWLPNVIQALDPWFSPVDIEKGAQWLADLTAQLNEVEFAIICVTPDSISAPWLLFEAGAAANKLASTNVCPVLLSIQQGDFEGPISQFQPTQAVKEDIRGLLKTINAHLKSPLSEKLLENAFEKHWEQLNNKIDEISKKTPAAPRRTPDELLQELVARTRAIERQLSEGANRDALLTRDYLAQITSRSALAVAKAQIDALVRKMQIAEHDRRHLVSDWIRIHRHTTDEAKKTEMRVAVEQAKSADTQLREDLHYSLAQLQEMENSIRNFLRGSVFKLMDNAEEGKP